VNIELDRRSIIFSLAVLDVIEAFHLKKMCGHSHELMYTAAYEVVPSNVFVEENTILLSPLYFKVSV
jgi:hypothetical protein